MDDVRRNAQKRAARPSTLPVGSSFESERQKQKAALVRQIDELDGSKIQKISAATERTDSQKTLRVAAYCRVSTDDIDQAISIELQMRQYKEKIKSNPDWKYAGTYVDNGFSGTNTAHRPGFLKLIEDARAGKIDMIITKAVSRSLFGYDKIEIPDSYGGKRKMLQINEQQAQVVKWMYASLLNGSTTEEIASVLTELQIPTGDRKKDSTLNTDWTSSGVLNIMRNERYCGDVLARKNYTPNFKDHKSKKNRGKKNKYYQPDHHDAIVTRAVWNAAQRILNSRRYGHEGSYQASSFAVQNMFHTIDEDYLHTLAYILTNGLDNGGGDFRLTDSIEIPSMRGEAYEVPCNSAIAGLTAEFSQFLADPKVHPLIKSAVSQAWVLTVRPFPEGNERLARLLSSVILIRAGYTFFSNVSLSALIARNGYSYFNAIANILRTENAADDAVQVSAQEKVKPKTNKNADKVKKAIQKLRRKGINNIISSDIAREADISPKQAYRALEFLEEEGYISCVRRTTGGNRYVLNSGKTKAGKTEHTQATNKQDLIAELEKRTNSPKDSTSKIAGLLLDYIISDKLSFTVTEIADRLGIDSITVRNVIIWFTRFNYIKTASHDGKCMASKRNWNEEDARTRVRILFEGEWYADRG